MNSATAGSKTIPAVMSALREPDRFVQETAASARDKFGDCLDDVRTYAGKEPDKALLAALAAGYVMRGLPLVRIGGTFLRLVLGLVKPLGVLYGGAKVWEILQSATSGGDSKPSAKGTKKSGGEAAGE